MEGRTVVKNILVPIVMGEIFFIAAALVGGFHLKNSWGVLAFLVLSGCGFGFMFLGLTQFLKLRKQAAG